MEFFTISSNFTPKWRRDYRLSSMEFMLQLLSLFLFINCCLCDREVGHADDFTKSIVKSEVIIDGKVVSEGGDDGSYGTYAQGCHINHDRPIKGRLVHVYTEVNKSNHGCDQIDPKIVPSIPWIALIQRGVCSFNEKIYYATKKSNASAVIIFNDDENSGIDKPLVMSVDDNYDVKDVTAIFIHYQKGQDLLSLLKRYKYVNVSISVGEQHKNKDNQDNPQLNNTSVLFVSISFIVLIIISLAWLVFYYIQRCRYTNAKERLSRRLANAAKKAIAKIPQRSVRIGDKELEAEADQCAVCIEPYKISDVIRVLPCKHVFHKSCVDPWLLDQRSCPMCKMDILRAFGMHLNDSQESVPQDAESGLMSSSPAVEEAEPLSHSDEGGAMGGVKIVLYQHALHYDRDNELNEPGQSSTVEYNSRARYAIDSEESSSECSHNLSSPVGTCQIECTSHALVEPHAASDISNASQLSMEGGDVHRPLYEGYDDGGFSGAQSLELIRSDSVSSFHSVSEDEDTNERRSLIAKHGHDCVDGQDVTASSSNLESKSLQSLNRSGSIVLSIKD